MAETKIDHAAFAAALRNGISFNALYVRVHHFNWDVDRAINTPLGGGLETDNRVYALYKGDSLLDIGTLKEIAANQGVAIRTIYGYKNPSYAKRTPKGKGRTLVLLDDDEEEEETTWELPHKP